MVRVMPDRKPVPKIDDDFTEAIRAQLRLRGMPISQLATAIGTSSTRAYALLSGGQRWYLEDLRRAAEALGSTVELLARSAQYGGKAVLADVAIAQAPDLEPDERDELISTLAAIRARRG
jgi:hypothetical protein